MNWKILALRVLKAAVREFENAMKDETPALTEGNQNTGKRMLSHFVNYTDYTGITRRVEIDCLGANCPHCVLEMHR